MLKRIGLVMMLAAGMAMADQATVEKAERAWGAAMMKNDYAALDKLMADDLIYRHSNGIVDSKKSYVDALKSGKSAYYTIAYDEIKVKDLDANTALAFCKATFVTKAADGNKQTMPLLLLHVFRKKGGDWQLVAHQSARVPQ